jgi:hypothetical protein
MQAILFVLATGILAFPVVELFEHWRRYQVRRSSRCEPLMSDGHAHRGNDAGARSRRENRFGQLLSN